MRILKSDNLSEVSSWKWLDSILREAGIDEAEIRWPQNREEIDEVVRQYVSEQASNGRCSADLATARKEINANEGMKLELTRNLRLLYLKWIDHFEYKKRLSKRANYLRLLSAKR